jgi:hypothetical protein
LSQCRTNHTLFRESELGVADELSPPSLKQRMSAVVPQRSSIALYRMRGAGCRFRGERSRIARPRERPEAARLEKVGALHRPVTPPGILSGRPPQAQLFPQAE